MPVAGPPGRWTTCCTSSSLASYNAGLAALTQELVGLAGPVEVNGKKGEIDLAPANQLFGDA